MSSFDGAADFAHLRPRPVAPSGGLTSWAPLFLAVLASIGCGTKTAAPGLPGQRIALQLSGVTVSVEVACDGPSRQLGLMHRKSLPENAGMLFIFPQLRRQNFWMRNTHVPLSIAFIDDKGRILQIEHMKPKDERHTVSMSSVSYALEVNQGWFDRHGVGVGDSISDFQSQVGRFRASS
jgi:uncharacterized membrane protein (UPF0127 family)